jgi:hypothetical protein
LQVGVGCPLRGQFGGRRLEQIAELEHVVLQAGVLIDQLLPGINEAGLEPVGDVGAAAMATDQQLARDELLDRFAQ